MAEILLDTTVDEVGREEYDKMVHSKSVEVGRWVNGKVEPGDTTRRYINRRLNNVLNIRISEEKPGQWSISRTEDETKGQTEELRSQADKLISEVERRKELEGSSDNMEDLLLEVLLEFSKSLSSTLRQLIEIKKNREDEDR